MANKKTTKTIKAKGNLGGRPKINWKLVEPELIALLADGMSQAKACSYVGISEQTLIEYKKKNLGYSERLEKAFLETHKLAHKSVKVGMLKDWKAGAWWLERTEPERFQEKKTLEVSEKPSLIQNMFPIDDEETNNAN